MTTGSEQPDPTDRPVSRAPRAGGTESENPSTSAEKSPAQKPPAPGSRTSERPDRKPEGTSEQEPVTGEVEVRGGGRTAVLWTALILGAIILVLLLIFVIQNNVTTSFEYLGTQFELPLGVAMLLAAIAGALVMGLVGSVRIIQLSWGIRKLRKAQEKVRKASR